MSLALGLDEQVGDSGIAAGEMTVAGLLRAMSDGSLTSAELTGFCLDRIGRLNPELGAEISVSGTAREAAAACDAARAAGTVPGPLAGLPVLIKDNISVSGEPATAGSPALAGAAAADAFLIRRLRAAGAVLIGKANLSEWANFRSPHSTSGWSTLGGQAVNPHGTGRNPSGSSSGSAVAVAAGLAPLAIGTETDGSIVSPASACGVVGIKPTVGLVSRAGIVPVSLAQDTAGPMARCVADAAALLGAMAGPDPGDPLPWPERPPPGDYSRFLDDAALHGARIGIWRDGSAAASPAVSAVLDAAVGVLRDHGARVTDPVRLDGADKLEEPELTALLHEFKSDLNAYLAGLPGEHPATLADLIEFNTRNESRVLARFGQELFEQAERTAGRGAPEHLAARAEAAALARSAIDGALAGGLTAVAALTCSPAWLTDYVLGDPAVFGTSGPAAVAGYPSVSLPAGQVAGLPVGISFIGPPWSEPVLIGLSYAFEQARARAAAAGG
jgi:amidase